MSGKFIRRTLRNVVFRNRPYFAHLALTHRCNLRCRFCHIQETRFQELDTAGMKRVIDRLDEMGVGVVSISGGGEPLLRGDFAEIVNYAADKGMYTKLTTNGTMPERKCDELLRSRVKEIGVSLDGVHGNDLPFSHTGPLVLKTIRYLHDHLPAGKQLTINVTVSGGNRAQLDEILEYCAREYPRAKVWLNPVMVGDGALRTSASAASSPDYLRRARSPNQLWAKFYTEGVERQSRVPSFDWGCLAGNQFFDIKPSGDFWLCQDKPSRTPLNILEPGFLEKLRSTDFSYRRKCAGCTYSCYYVTQNGFKPRNWPDMAALWWDSNTLAGDRCRSVASRYGWMAGLAFFILGRLRPAAAAAALALLFLIAGKLKAASPDHSPEAVLACMERANDERQASILPFTSERVYTAANRRLGRSARVVALVRYSPPGEKTFDIVSRSGSRAIQKRVIEPLLETECRNARPQARASTDICRRNYDFEFVEVDENGAGYIFLVQPKTPGKYRFRGKVWVDPQACGIRRLEGEPCVSPSFWVTKTLFQHNYGPFDRFWLPLSHRTEVQLRIFGRSTLDIDYSSYSWGEEPNSNHPGVEVVESR